MRYTLGLRQHLFVFIICISHCSVAQTSVFPLYGKKICIDPGHGGTADTDKYRVGATGEREEWINLRVAMILKNRLQEKGATVLMTRISDTSVDLSMRAELATSEKADMFISIHHNATADRTVNFPIIYFHGAASENNAGVELAKHLATSFRKRLYKKKTPATVVSDYTIFPDKGASVLRNTYGIPGVLAEASFFSNEREEERLKTGEHNSNEASAYVEAIEMFFSRERPTIKEKKIPLELPVFAVLEEADRMKPEALQWMQDYREAKKIMKRRDSASVTRAYELFTRSARSFPDSFVARECHEFRSRILLKMGRNPEALSAEKRSKEYYVNF